MNVTIPAWERCWSPPRRLTVERQRRSTAQRRRSSAERLDVLVPNVSSGERRNSPGPPSLRGELTRHPRLGSSVFDLVNPEIALQRCNAKDLQVLVHGVGLSCSKTTCDRILMSSGNDGAAAAGSAIAIAALRGEDGYDSEEPHTPDTVCFEVVQYRRRPKQKSRAKNWNRPGAVGVDSKTGKAVARQHTGVGGNKDRGALGGGRREDG